MTDCIKRDYDNTVLVLQGGGALGAYQAGVYEGLAEAGYAPNWVTGVSIGAINAALIAGNPPELRVERLRAFWNLVSSGLLVSAPRGHEGMHRVFNRASSAISAAMGVPGFYRPRMPPAALMPDGHPDGLSLYDTRSLRGTLERLVDFDLINAARGASQRRVGQRPHRKLGLLRQRADPVGSGACDGERRAAAHLCARGDRRRALLGRGHRFEHPAVVRPRRLAPPQGPHRPGRSVQRQGRAAAQSRSGHGTAEGHHLFEQVALQHEPPQGVPEAAVCAPPRSRAPARRVEERTPT